MNGKVFINNFRNTRLNPFSPLSPPSLITRGDIQKRNRTKQVAQGEMDMSKDNGQVQEALPTVPKAPSFRYKNPVVENNIAYWTTFADNDSMQHYDDLIDILDNTDSLIDERNRDTSLENIREYMNQLKGTTMYKVNPGIQKWVGDLESMYYGIDKKYDLSFPTDLMRHQTMKAKAAFDSGYAK